MNTLRCSVCHSCVRRADAFASANLLKVLMKVTLLSPASMSVKRRNPGTWFRRGTRRSSTRWINSSLVPGMRSYERITMYIVLPFLLLSLEGLQIASSHCNYSIVAALRPHIAVTKCLRFARPSINRGLHYTDYSSEIPWHPQSRPTHQPVRPALAATVPLQPLPNPWFPLNHQTGATACARCSAFR